MGWTLLVLVGYGAGYFLGWLRYGRAPIEGIADGVVSENTAKYQAREDFALERTGYYRLTDEQVERIWVAVREETCECGCEEFTESERQKGRLQ